jgi:hypothetical protein
MHSYLGWSGAPIVTHVGALASRLLSTSLKEEASRGCVAHTGILKEASRRFHSLCNATLRSAPDTAACLPACLRSNLNQ